MARSRAEPLKKRHITAADEWHDETMEKCARAMAAWMKATINTSRPINSLKLDELIALANNATACWIVEASHRVGRAPTEEENKRLAVLLA
jgi:hypothetical protein